jgi:hypothetical protein
MAIRLQRASYFYTLVKDRPGEAFKVLTQLAKQRVNLLAFSAIPTGLNQAQLALYPQSVEQLVSAAEQIGLVLDGPHAALLVHGEDTLGALAEIHARLFDANINVYASTGITDGKGCFGYLIYLRAGDIDHAISVLGTHES